jgi:hypothetical protein
MDTGDSRAVNIWNGRGCMGVKYSGQHSDSCREIVWSTRGKTVTMGAEALETCRFGDALNCTGPHAVDFLAQANAGSAEDLGRFNP